MYQCNQLTRKIAVKTINDGDNSIWQFSKLTAR